MIDEVVAIVAGVAETLCRAAYRQAIRRRFFLRLATDLYCISYFAFEMIPVFKDSRYESGLMFFFWGEGTIHS